MMLFTHLEEQLRVFLLFHILPRRFFSHLLLLPFKCFLFGQPTTKMWMLKVMCPPFLIIIHLPFLSQSPLLSLHGQVTIIISPQIAIPVVMLGSHQNLSLLMSLGNMVILRRMDSKPTRLKSLEWFRRK